MSSATQLVEHFFRHEYGRIVAALTSRMGTVNLQIIEDAVQTAMSRALSTWPRRGLPDNPSAWLYRCAANEALDSLRHQAMASRKLALQAESAASRSVPEETPAIDDEPVGDKTLRLLFLCCHDSIPAESRVALALRIVGGFSIKEIAAGLLTTPENIEKRLTRAKSKLQELREELVDLDNQAVAQRLESVRATIYLIFNEGYAASSGDSPIRQDLCEEAIRLSRMLTVHPLCAQPTSSALLSLLLLHSARMSERLDSAGSITLLADQDRSHWNWHRVREAMGCMEQSASGDQLSRYHIECAIAWEHCRAREFSETDWSKIVRLYRLLEERFDSPAVRLNLAIAVSYAENVKTGLAQLLQLSIQDRRVLRPWWDCAMAQLLARDDQVQAAVSHWRDALALATCTAQRSLIEAQLRSQQPS
jgi:RNA polymerase sigma factor (sigma-70 family)